LQKYFSLLYLSVLSLLAIKQKSLTQKLINYENTELCYFRFSSTRSRSGGQRNHQKGVQNVIAAKCKKSQSKKKETKK
jgi:hypothetical protein